MSRESSEPHVAVSTATAAPAAHAPSRDPGSAAAAERRVTLSHRLQYGATRVLIGFLRLIGWSAAGQLGEWLGALAYRAGIRRGVAERQIAAAFPEFSLDEVRATALGSFRSIGRTFIEAAILPGASPAEMHQRFNGIDGWDILEDAMAEGNGTLLVSGHLGNWELAGSYIASRGVPLVAVARGMENPLFDAYLQRGREATGLIMVRDRDAVRYTPRALREGRVVGFLCDQDALGLASTFVPFFGRPAKTPRGPAVFAQRWHTPLVFVTVRRESNGRYRVIFERVPIPAGDNREAVTDAIVLGYTQQLEAHIRRSPDQYFWQHRRWKRQPPDTPLHLREP